MTDEEKTILHNQIIEVFQNNQTSVDDAFQIIIGLFISFSYQGSFDQKKFNILLDELKNLYKKWLADKEKNV